jgi:Zn-dependent protease with chaperone function
MTVAALALVVTLAAIPVAYVALVMATAALRSRPDRTAVSRAALMFVRGVAPTTGAMLVAFGLVLPAFLMFEPPHDGERVGRALILIAALGAAQIVRIGVRLVRMLRLSRRFTTAWIPGARPIPGHWGLPTFAIDAAFPVVALAGFVRPTLFVDRRVLAVCSPAELAAIAAHERAHVRGRDNLRRLLLGVCAGPASVTAAAWREAAEEAADARAADSASRAVELASALLKVARLAPTRSLEATALSTIHDGGNLEARIHHLLAHDGPSQRTCATRVVLCAAGPVVALMALNASALLSSVHRVIEIVVTYLR